MKKILLTIAAVFPLLTYATGLDSNGFNLDFSFNDEVLGKKSRSFTKINDGKTHDIKFQDYYMDDEYSVYLLKLNDGRWQAKSMYSSEVSNFATVLYLGGYGIGPVEYTVNSGERAHANFTCDDLANKMIADTNHMISID